MTQPRYDLLGLGNAIVDIIAQVPDGFLDALSYGQGRDDLDRRGPG